MLPPIDIDIEAHKLGTRSENETVEAEVCTKSITTVLKWIGLDELDDKVLSTLGVAPEHQNVRRPPTQSLQA